MLTLSKPKSLSQGSRYLHPSGLPLGREGAVLPGSGRPVCNFRLLIVNNLMGPQNVPFLTHTCDKKKTNSSCYPKANNSQNGLFLSPDRLSTPDGEILLFPV